MKHVYVHSSYVIFQDMQYENFRPEKPFDFSHLLKITVAASSDRKWLKTRVGWTPVTGSYSI